MLYGHAFRTEDRGLWFITGPFWFEFHLSWWRLGIGVRRWSVGVYLGPIVLAIGRPTVNLYPRQKPTSWSVSVESLLDDDASRPKAGN